MKLDVPAIDPVATIRSFREHHVNMRRLIAQADDAPAGVVVRTPAEQPILELDLPAALRDGMAAFQKEQAKGRRLTPVKYMKTVNGSPMLVVEDDAPLPEEGDLVTFTHTLSTASVRAVSVVSHQLVATLGTAPKPAGPRGAGPTPNEPGE